MYSETNTKTIDTDGIIIKSIGGIYSVEAPTGVIECRARGIFRNRNESPCCGDKVRVEFHEGTPIITKIYDRKNEIVRPPLANLGLLVFVVSSCEPSPNYLIIDKFTAISRYKGIDCAIVITKIDKKSGDEIRKIYELAGIPVFEVDNMGESNTTEIQQFLSDKLSAFTGNTGAGKSTLLNNLIPDISIKTNEISRKLGRGKHTTRHVELYKYGSGYIADTPGFSTFETNKYDIILKSSLAECFIEFDKYIGTCKFQDCAHIKEKGCAILEGVEMGEIHKSRHASYVSMYEDAKLIKEWSKNGK